MSIADRHIPAQSGARRDGIAGIHRQALAPPEATCVTTFTGNSEMPQLAMTADATLIAAGERGGLTRVS